MSTRISISWCFAHGFYHGMIWEQASGIDRKHPDYIVLKRLGNHSHDDKRAILRSVNDRILKQVVTLEDLGLLVAEEI